DVHALVTGDFDGNGKFDLAFVRGTFNGPIADRVNVLLSNGNGTFNAAPTFFPGSTGNVSINELSVGDFNNYHKSDLGRVYHSFANSPRTYILEARLGKGDGTFASAGPAVLGNGFSVGPPALAGGDFNGDGSADFPYIPQGQNTVTVLLSRFQNQ